MKIFFAPFLIAAVFFTLPSLQAEKTSKFLLSSDQIFSTDQLTALKDLDSFMFVFSLKMNQEEAPAIVDFFNKELSKVGRVVKKEIFSQQGIDLDCFSLPCLKLSLGQLANPEQKPLSVLKVELAVNNLVEIAKNKSLVSIDTSSWSFYLNESQETTLSALQKSTPFLLRSFLDEFTKANGSGKQPTFFIIYDSSWW